MLLEYDDFHLYLDIHWVMVLWLSPVVSVWAHRPGSVPSDGHILHDRIQLRTNVVVFALGKHNHTIMTTDVKGL